VGGELGAPHPPDRSGCGSEQPLAARIRCGSCVQGWRTRILGVRSTAAATRQLPHEALEEKKSSKAIPAAGAPLGEQERAAMGRRRRCQGLAAELAAHELELGSGVDSLAAHCGLRCFLQVQPPRPLRPHAP